MTDFVPPPVPQSPIARFGTSIVGAQFEWDYISDDGAEPQVVSARAAASISFEDTLRYTTGRHAQLVQTANSAKAMRESLDGLTPTDPEYPAKFNQLIEQRLAFEQATWAAAIDIMLILVNETDRERLRPALVKGDPRKVNELRTWLERQVLTTAQEDAAVSTGVDPTSPPPPPPSVSTPDSGPDSDSEDSPSTD